MKKQWLVLLALLMAFVLIVSACNRNKEEDSDSGDSSQLTGEQVEAAMQAAIGGDLSLAREITCAAEMPAEDEEMPDMEMPEGMEMSYSCSRDGDVMNCSVTISMAGESQSESISYNIVDEKLCGNVE